MIVAMTHDHIAPIMEIDKQVYPEPWSKKLWTTELGRGTEARHYVVALNTSGADPAQILGYAGMLKTADEAHVVTVVTSPEHQGRGLGTSLMLELAHNAVLWGCTALTLEVRASNRPAHALYRRFGMAPVGVRKNYYSPDNEDALIMTAHNIDQPAFGTRLSDLAQKVTT